MSDITEHPDPSERAVDASSLPHEPMCDHICLKPEGHVERGEPHFYGYELPSPRSADETIHVLRASLATAASEITRLREQNQALTERTTPPGEAAFDGDRALLALAEREGWDSVALETKALSALLDRRITVPQGVSDDIPSFVRWLHRHSGDEAHHLAARLIEHAYLGVGR